MGTLLLEAIADLDQRYWFWKRNQRCDRLWINMEDVAKDLDLARKDCII